MRSFDLALDWQIHHVETSVIDLDEVTLKVQLRDGLFSLAPFSGTLSGGTMEGSLEITHGRGAHESGYVSDLPSIEYLQ